MQEFSHGRLLMQSLKANYLQTVSSSHRKTWGQFFTHPEVARFMVRWVIESGNADLYDPGFGLGAFWNALPRDSGVVFASSEADSRIIDFWSAAANDDRVEVCREDYLQSWGRRHGNIVCNPPYSPFQRFPNRHQVLAQFAQNLNLKLSGYTNTASAFLLKSLSELAPGGRLAYIMPLEFLNAGYGALVKEQLMAERHLAAIIRLECEREVIPDAVTSLGVLLYDNGERYSGVKFYTAKSIRELDSLMDNGPVDYIPYARLSAKDKWLPYFDSARRTPDYANTVPLALYGRFSRGIATGANQFFALRPSQARKLGLESGELAPAITKSAQVQKPWFTPEDYAKLVKADARSLLFDVNENVSPAAQLYIQSGEQQGFHQGYITRTRTPWYKNETRQPAPLLLGVFSRGGYKIVRNTSYALNLTCFHGFQPNLSGQCYVDHLFLYFHSHPGREIVSLSVRKYGDSLDKFEPNDLNSALVPVPRVLDAIPTTVVESAMQELRATGRIPVSVDTWFKDLTL